MTENYLNEDYYQNTRNKLYDAIRDLAIGEKDAKTRLIQIEDLFILLNNEQCFPEKYWPIWQSIHKNVTAIPPTITEGLPELTRSSFRNTIHSLRNKRASMIIREIVNLYELMECDYIEKLKTACNSQK